MTWSSINCAYVRLSQIVGLNRVVDSTYRMAQSNYLYPGQPRRDREPIRPYISYSTGANEMSPLDMASGGADHRQQRPPPPAVLRGVHRHRRRSPDLHPRERRHAGPRRRGRPDDGRHAEGRPDRGNRPLGNSLAGERPAAGKTGTQQDNTNAWFVGFTPQITTAVWVGDPNGYTPMVEVPEFGGRNASRVQGGRYPAEIWKAYMDRAHEGLPVVDWALPPAPARPAALLYLPGNECLVRRATPIVPGEPGSSTSTSTTAPAGPAGFMSAAAPTTVVPPGETPPAETQPPVETVPPPVVAAPAAEAPTPATPAPAAAPSQSQTTQVTTAARGQSRAGAPTVPPTTARVRADRARHDGPTRRARPPRTDAVCAAGDRGRRTLLSEDVLALQRLDTSIDQADVSPARLPERDASAAAGKALDRSRSPPGRDR